MKCWECKVVDIPEPRYCCNGVDCACRGQPIDPPFCDSCWDKILKRGAAATGGAGEHISQHAKGETVRCCADCQYVWPECGAKNMGCGMFSPRTASPVCQRWLQFLL